MPYIGTVFCQNKRPWRLIFRCNRKNISRPIKSHRVLCTPPFEKSSNKAHRFCVLPPLKTHYFWWALISGCTFISTNTSIFFKITFIPFLFPSKIYHICRNKHPPKTVIFKGGSTQNRWALLGDFSEGGVHKTDGLCWMISQRGEYIKPMAFDGFCIVFYCC